MGYASASREEKLKMKKTSSTRKAVRKLNSLSRKGKLSRAVKDSFQDIKSRKAKDATKRVFNIQDDWVADREVQYNEEEEDILPLDMMDADIDWENSAFANVKRRHDKKNGDEDEDSDDDVHLKRRKFGGQLGENMEEMLPIKLQDGTLIRPTREKKKTEEADESGEMDEQMEDEEEEEKPEEEDVSHLSAPELLLRRKQMLEEFKQTISTQAHHLLANPQENIFKLRDMYHLCAGQKVHSLVRETVQKLAMASMVQVLVNILPGYAIRTLTDEERQQQRKKDLKQLQDYEESLLRYYLKYLQLCEKFSGKFVVRGRILKEDTFSYKIGLLSVKAMARLMTSCPQFNYTTNIISTMVRLSLSKTELVVAEACGALAALFKEDIHLKMTLFGARSVSTLVTKRKGRVPPPLLATFLSMNIKEVKNVDKKSHKGAIFSKRARVKKERASKSARKYKKQLDKLEADLKELDEEETINDKLKNATEAMKYVFQTYFSILKRMPTLTLLEPVLEGLSKYAHLLNVEFFEDIVFTMEDLVERKQLRLIDQLHCVNTVFVILSGEGQLLNVDPSRFYRNVYRILNHLPFETKPEMRHRQMMVMSKTIYLMLNERRKQVPVPRVAAFVKRSLAVATVMDDLPALCLIALMRTLFIAHPKLICLVEEDESGGGAGGACRPDLDDPDLANAMGGSVRLELTMLAKRRHKSLSAFAKNMLAGVPSTGPLKLSPQETSIKPWDLMNLEMEQAGGYEKVETKYMDDIRQYCAKRKQGVTPQNIQFHISNWLESRDL